MPATARCTPPVTGDSSVETPCSAARRRGAGLVQIVGTHVDSRATGGEPLEDAVLAGDRCGDGFGGGQAGDDGVRDARRLRGGARPGGACLQKRGRGVFVDVVQRDREAGAQQTAGQAPAQTARRPIPSREDDHQPAAGVGRGNLIYGLGMLESGVTIDDAQLVMDAEFARMVKFCVPGIPATDETLSVDVIAEVGPFSDFLSHDDTYKGMRGQSRSTLIDRRVREDWAASGLTSLNDRALVEARDILETHVPEQLPDELAAKLKSLILAAKDELGVH